MTAEMKDWMVNCSVYLSTEEHNDRKYTNMQSLLNHYQNAHLEHLSLFKNFFNTELCVCFMKKCNDAVWLKFSLVAWNRILLKLIWKRTVIKIQQEILRTSTDSCWRAAGSSRISSGMVGTQVLYHRPEVSIITTDCLSHPRTMPWPQLKFLYCWLLCVQLHPISHHLHAKRASLVAQQRTA